MIMLKRKNSNYRKKYKPDFFIYRNDSYLCIYSVCPHFVW